MPQNESRIQTIEEETANTATHAIGALISIWMSISLFFSCIGHSNVETLVGMAIYGICSAFMFTMSSAYHAARTSQLKHRFRLLDHIAIYVAIAGFNTPVCLHLLSYSPSSCKWIFISTLAFQWLAVIWGSIFKMFTVGRYKMVSTSIYLILGWTCIVPIIADFSMLSQSEMAYVVSSGMLFTIGSVFYSLSYMKYFHAIWHLFVVVATIFHQMFVLSLVK